ncbi:MAG: AAA family ATPase [Candidatus Melainabacteria bacterium]|nr:AAA family ATPase [Candidatus Melainabacteria bacterium]
MEQQPYSHVGDVASQGGKQCPACQGFSPLDGRFCCHCGFDFASLPAGGALPRELAPVQLERFALVSVELLDLSAHPGTGHPVSDLKALAAQYSQALEARIAAWGGVVETVHNNVVFVAFPYDPTLVDSLDSAIQFSLELVQRPFVVNDVPWQVRVGLDEEEAASRNPLTCVTERSVAAVNAVVMSTRAYQRVGGKRYKLEPVGPVRLGDQMVHFYQILGAAAMLPASGHSAIALEPAPPLREAAMPEPVKQALLGVPASQSSSLTSDPPPSQSFSDETPVVEASAETLPWERLSLVEKLTEPEEALPLRDALLPTQPAVDVTETAMNVEQAHTAYDARDARRDEWREEAPVSEAVFEPLFEPLESSEDFQRDGQANSGLDSGESDDAHEVSLDGSDWDHQWDEAFASVETPGHPPTPSDALHQQALFEPASPEDSVSSSLVSPSSLSSEVPPLESAAQTPPASVSGATTAGFDVEAVYHDGFDDEPVPAFEDANPTASLPVATNPAVADRPGMVSRQAVAPFEQAQASEPAEAFSSPAAAPEVAFQEEPPQAEQGVEHDLDAALQQEIEASLQQRAERGSSEADGLVELQPYVAPVYFEKQALPPPNTTYEQLVQRLATRLQPFLDAASPETMAPTLSVNHLTGTLITVGGTSGLGKTTILQMVRLKTESEDPQQPKGLWLGGSAPESVVQPPMPLGVWQDAFRNFFGISVEHDEPAALKTQVGNILQFLFDGPPPAGLADTFEVMLSLQPLAPLGLEVRDQVGRLAQAMEVLLKAMSQKKPVVLVLEDLDQADAASLEVLMHLLKNGLLTQRVFILVTHQREAVPVGDWAQLLQVGAFERWILSDLNDEEIRKFLADGTFGEHLTEFPEPYLTTFIQQSRGLPLYLEESWRWLHLQGLLAVNAETGKLGPSDPQTLTDETLPPPALDAMVRQRLQALTKESLYVLQMASVCGHKVGLESLMILCRIDEEQVLQQHLQELWEHGWILPDIGRSVAFRHGALRQAVYHTLAEEIRLQLHQFVSEFLDQAYNSGRVVPPYRVAQHAQLGGLYQRAFHYWNLAAVQSVQLGSLVAFNECLFAALACLAKAALPEAAAIQRQMLETLGSLNAQENPDLSVRILEPISRYAEQVGDSGKRMEILTLLAQCYESKAAFIPALETLDSAVELLSPLEYPLERAALLTDKMHYLVTLGRLEEARLLMVQQLEPLYAAADLRDSVYLQSFLRARRLLAEVAIRQCDASAKSILEAGYQMAREHDLHALCLEYGLTQVRERLACGQYADCQSLLNELLTDIEQQEKPAVYLGMWGLLALQTHCELGDWNNAAMLVPNTVFQSERGNDFLTWTQVNAYAGFIQYFMGQLAEARQLLEQAITHSADYRFATAALLGWRLLAQIELQTESYTVAAELAERALAVAQKPEVTHTVEEIQLTLVHAQALMALGEVKAAGRILEQLWPRVTQTPYPPLIASAAAAIGDLYSLLAKASAQQPGTSAAADLLQAHLDKAITFYRKAMGGWHQLGNPYQLRQVQARANRLTQMAVQP